mgnify:CR=1 FL=1
MKAFLGVKFIMGINSLPPMSDYWSSNPYLGSEGMKKVMTKNRFEDLSCYLHLNDSTAAPARGDSNYGRLYKTRTVLDYVDKKVLEVQNPNKNISVDVGKIALRDVWHFVNTCRLNSKNMELTLYTAIRHIWRILEASWCWFWNAKSWIFIIHNLI